MSGETYRLRGWAVRLLGIDRTEALIGQLIVAAASARLFRDDMHEDDLHEARHLYAAIKAGNSDDCDAGSCILDRQALADWTAMEQARYDDPFAIRSGSFKP